MSKNNPYDRFPISELITTLVCAVITILLFIFAGKLMINFSDWGGIFEIIPIGFGFLALIILFVGGSITIGMFKQFCEQVHLYSLAKKDVLKAVEYDKKQKEYRKAQQDREMQKRAAEYQREYDEAIASQQSTYGKHYFTEACPYCGHLKVRLANWDDKRMSVAFWGGYSDKIGKAFQCDYCHRTFNN